MDKLVRNATQALLESDAGYRILPSLLTKSQAFDELLPRWEH